MTLVILKLQNEVTRIFKWFRDNILMLIVEISNFWHHSKMLTMMEKMNRPKLVFEIQALTLMSNLIFKNKLEWKKTDERIIRFQFEYILYLMWCSTTMLQNVYTDHMISFGHVRPKKDDLKNLLNTCHKKNHL